MVLKCGSEVLLEVPEVAPVVLELLLELLSLFEGFLLFLDRGQY